MAKIPELSIDDIIDAVDEHELCESPLLFVSGGKERTRIGVFAIGDDDEITLMVDAIPTEDDIIELATGLEPSRMGRWDVEGSARWRFVWTIGSAAWTLWSRKGGKAFWLDGEELHRSGPRPPVPAKQIAAVQTYASPGWYEQGAEIRLKEDTTIEIAETTNWTARLDPTYGRHELTTDLQWAEDLAKDLAQIIGVPVGESIPDREG